MGDNILTKFTLVNLRYELNEKIKKNNAQMERYMELIEELKKENDQICKTLFKLGKEED